MNYVPHHRGEGGNTLFWCRSFGCPGNFLSAVHLLNEWKDFD